MKGKLYEVYKQAKNEQAEQSSKEDIEKRLQGNFITQIRERLQDRYSYDKLFFDNQKTWYKFSTLNGHWEVANRALEREANSIAKEIVRECEERKLAITRSFRNKLQHGYSTRAAIRDLEPYLINLNKETITPQFDTIGHLIGIPKGVIDLRTGTIRNAQNDEYVHRSLSYDPVDEPCPVFLEFLDHISSHNEEVKNWLFHWLGLCLIGEPNSRIILFILGSRGSGKSTFSLFLQTLLEHYATSINNENLDFRNFAQHATWKAALRGKRFISMSEIKEGMKLNTQALNELTGGDLIKANLMRQDEIEFQPMSNWLIVGNHYPRLPVNRDDGIYDRLRLLELNEQPNSVDRELNTKLKNEQPAILHFLLEYAEAYLENGLPETPEIMQVAAENYTSNQDNFKNDILDLIQEHSKSLVDHITKDNPIIWLNELRSQYNENRKRTIDSSTKWTQMLKNRFKISELVKFNGVKQRFVYLHDLGIRLDDDYLNDESDPPPF